MGELAAVTVNIIDESTVKKPQFEYQSRVPCPLADDTICCLISNIRESQLWCPMCSAEHIFTALYRVFTGAHFNRPWPEHVSFTTGQVVRGEQHLREQLKRASGENSERLGMNVDLQPVPLSEIKSTSTDEGMAATHDRQVKEGSKDSRGRFVF